jgi:NADPH:quinone reductase
MHPRPAPGFVKALRFDRFGSLDALKVEQVGAPLPAYGEALVRVRAAGVNPSDVKNVLGAFPQTTLPRIPGRDFAGVVAEGPAEWVEREVWGTGAQLGFTRDGTHAEYLTLPIDGLTLKPVSLSFALAASCGVPYTTAWNALDRSGVALRESLVVVGVGAVGSAALALARARGARVVAAVRKETQAAELRARGVPVVLLTDASAFPRDVRRELPAGADVIFDTTGHWVDAAVPAIAEFGRIVTIAAPKDGYVRFPVLDFYHAGGVLVGVNSLLYDVAACARMLEPIAAAFDRAELPPPIPIRVAPLEEGPAVYRAINAGSTGKFVLVMP